MRDLARIRQQLSAIEATSAAAPDRLAVRADSVSRWSVAEQYDHALRVVNGIAGALLEPGVAPARGINLTGRAVLLLGWIPRGAGRVPEGYGGLAVTPTEITAAATEGYARLTRLDAAWPTLPSGPIFRHPVFQGLTAVQTVRFAVIHTAHHLAIVRDILKTVRP